MKLFFRDLGDGFPVVILHGLFGMSDNWMTVGKKLSEIYRVIIPDQRNHGNSSHDETWNYEVMVEDLNELMESEGLNEFFLIGHSMGGKVAMNYGKKYGKKVKKLIVVDIAPRYYPVHHQQILDALSSVNLQNIQSRSDVEDQLERRINDWGIRQFLLKNLSRNQDRFEWKFNLEVIKRNIENVGEALPQEIINTPALFIGGTKSDYITRDDKIEIKNIFPNSMVLHIRDAGHWVHAEKPDEFLETIVQFLRN